ncbi:MAG: HAMP domain-containing protein [Marinobacter sp.]|nr:HAMP domain-containing protein [Marinobacter sp.]
MTQKHWRWRYWPLKFKLMFLMLATSLLGILLVCASLIVIENHTYRNQMDAEMNAIAAVVAEQSAAALLFEDQGQLDSIISSLNRISSAELACVYDLDNRLLSIWSSERVLGCPAEIHTLQQGFGNSYYQILTPVLLDDETVGYFYLRAHLGVLAKHLGNFILMASAVGLVIWVGLIVVASALQRMISQPILELSDTADEIADKQDYGIRAPVRSFDELGHLSTAFNEMIATIQTQNQQIMDSYENLERVVAERTAELSLANKELEAFSYSVSHDLRQPLRAIDGFSQALEEDCADRLDETGLDYLRRVRAASIRMGHLIDGMLCLSRVTRQVIEYQDVDISALLAELRDELMASDCDIPSSISIQPGIVAQGDESMLRIAFYNLLENAWKYTSRCAQRDIRVSAEKTDDAVTIIVQDNGAGFDMQYVDKLFVAFNRLHSPSEFPGTGIGLATVYRVVRRHYGEISAMSSEGKGATFFVKLPRAALKGE